MITEVTLEQVKKWFFFLRIDYVITVISLVVILVGIPTVYYKPELLLLFFISMSMIALWFVLWEVFKIVSLRDRYEIARNIARLDKVPCNFCKNPIDISKKDYSIYLDQNSIPSTIICSDCKKRIG